MVNKDFFKALDELQATKGIDKEYFMECLEAGLTSAYKKNFGEGKSALVKLNPEKNTIRIFSYKTVVEEVEDEDKEISLQDAKLIKKSYKIGDEISNEEKPKDFGRIAAQTAKQVIMQRLHEAERKKIVDEISTKENELLTVIVRRIEGENVYVDMGITQVEGVLSKRDQIPGERYQINSRIKVFVKSVRESYNMPYVQVSRANAGFVKRLFELEVPEIQSGEVEIKSIARKAGYRTKIAVYSENENIDVIGTCVGNKGMRVNTIVNELNGEKIDIIPWKEDPAEFIAAALSPSPVLNVDVNVLGKTSLAVVPDEKLSLAIGKGGQNVSLAVKLTGWKIDVKPKSAVPSLNLAEEANYEDLFENDNAFMDIE